MATTRNTALSMAINWALSKAVTGLSPTKAQGNKSRLISYDKATWDQLFFAEYTIAAAGTQTIDFRSFTNYLGDAVTATKIAALLLIVDGANAAIKLEPGTANPLTWFFSGTTPALTVPTGGAWEFAQPLAQTVDATHRNLLLTNTGSGTATVDVAAIVGTT